jgi:hypothetical protein
MELESSPASGRGEQEDVIEKIHVWKPLRKKSLDATVVGDIKEIDPPPWPEIAEVEDY